MRKPRRRRPATSPYYPSQQVGPAAFVYGAWTRVESR